MPTTIEEVSARWPQYAQRAAWLHQKYPTGKIGIAGTGYGFVQYFLFANHGRQSWGCDIAWAVDRAKGILGAWANFVMSADVTNAAQMNQFRRLGNTGQNKYDIILTGDLLPCANDEAEAQVMLTNLRAIGVSLVHLITPAGDSQNQNQDILWRTMSQWRTIIGPGEVIVDPNLVEVP